MIRSFADQETEKVFYRRHSRRYAAVGRTALRKLRQIHAVSTVEELMEMPGNWLEKVKGSRPEQWSLRINGECRICFQWKDGDAFEVEIVDDH
jgi:proteic killer suppression protein